MKFLGLKNKRRSMSQLQKQIDAEVEAFEDQLRRLGVKFSIPVNDRKGKLYKGD